MENSFLETQITFKNDDNELYIGEVRKGKIILSPLKDINIHRLGYQIIMEGRGRTSSIKKTQSEKVLLQNQMLSAGETYEFDFDIKGMLPGSYKGKNIQFTWKIETFIELEENSYSEIRNALIKGFKLFKAFNPNKVLAEERDILIYQEPQPYNVVPAKNALQYSMGGVCLIFIIGFILSGVLIVNFSTENIPIIVYPIVGLLFILLLGTSFYKKSIIEKIIYEVGNLEGNQFMLILDLSKSWKQINGIKCKYKVIEKVVDDRGTSTSTHRSNIFSSKIKKEKRPKRNQNFVFNFPEKNLPASFQVGDISFIWEIEIEASILSGLMSGSSKQVITVTKEKK